MTSPITPLETTPRWFRSEVEQEVDMRQALERLQERRKRVEAHIEQLKGEALDLVLAETALEHKIYELEEECGL